MKSMNSDKGVDCPGGDSLFALLSTQLRKDSCQRLRINLAGLFALLNEGLLHTVSD